MLKQNVALVIFNHLTVHPWIMCLKSICMPGMPEKLVPIAGKLTVTAARRSGINSFKWPG